MTKKRLKDIFWQLKDEVPQLTAKHHIGAYAAQAAYFFMLSLIPIILLLLTMVQYTPLTKADIMTIVLQIFPTSVNNMITSIVNQVYNQSTGVIPVTIIVALWSAGKGVLALTTGFNAINDCLETRNYLFLRIRASFYTIISLLVFIVLLVMSVFGETLGEFIISFLPMAESGIHWFLDLQKYAMPFVLLIFLLLIYLYLPNRKVVFKYQFLGALCGTIGCIFMSWLFSVYLNYFPAFSSMYGSLTTVMLIMLWMYFCMYSILIGNEVNRVVERMFIYRDRQEQKIIDKAERIPKVEITNVEVIDEEKQ